MSVYSEYTIVQESKLLGTLILFIHVDEINCFRMISSVRAQPIRSKERRSTALTFILGL